MRKNNKPIAIVGGGIGGLTLAAALQKLGLDAVVFERAPELCEVGAGLGLWANATRCLEWLGIDEGYWEGKGCEVHAAEVGGPSGKVLSRCDIRPLSAELGARSYVVHRADLHAALASLVENEMIETGRPCNGLEQSDDDIRLRFSDRTEESFSLVVGADGLRSGVRASLFGKEEPRYSGQTCYRGIASLEGAEKHVLREVQGRGLRSAVISLSDDKVYWWATECIEANSDFSPEERKERLQRLFSDWKFGFPEALANTKAEAILQNDLCDRPPLRQWSSGRATLLGDAAHPMTPNLGQGACTAIEDAIVLAGLISQYGIENYATAFAAYEAERMGRCYKIMKQSRTFGKVGGWSHPAAVCLRQAAVAAMPSLVMAKMLRQQLGYRALA